MKIQSKTGFLVGVSLLMLGACSVEQNKVVNEPPVIRNDLAGYKTEYGRFEAKSVSVFLWPQLAAGQLRNTAQQVRHASRRLDQLIVQNELQTNEKIILENKFTLNDCLSLKATRRSIRNDPEHNVPLVRKWKEFAPVEANDPGYGEYLRDLELLTQCQTNQNRRIDIVSWKADEFDPSATELLGEIWTLIDPATYPVDQKQVNYKKVREVGSYVEISPEKVDLQLTNFIVQGFTPSTQIEISESDSQEEKEKKTKEYIPDAHYNAAKSLLTFSVIAPDVDNGLYEFSLERAPDLLTLQTVEGETKRLAVFLGDVVLIKDNIKSRVGSAKIVAYVNEKSK